MLLFPTVRARDEVASIAGFQICLELLQLSKNPSIIEMKFSETIQKLHTSQPLPQPFEIQLPVTPYIGQN